MHGNLKSLAGYNFIWIEEGEEIGEDEFRKLDDTLRTVKGRIRIVFTLNTPSVNHWILKKWFDLEPSKEAPGFYIPHLKADAKDVIYIGGTWEENAINLDANTIQRYEAYKQANPAYYWQVIRRHQKCPVPTAECKNSMKPKRREGFKNFPLCLRLHAAARNEVKAELTLSDFRSKLGSWQRNPLAQSEGRVPRAPNQKSPQRSQGLV